MGQNVSLSNQPHLRQQVPQSNEDGSKIPLTKQQQKLHGKVRTDHYATGDGNQQTMVQAELSPVNVGGASVSVAAGQDVRQDRTPGQNPSVFDVHVRQPIIDNVEIRGRVRTSVIPNGSSCQARVGVQASVPVSENGSVYVQVYGVDKVKEGGETSGLRAGTFVGYDRKITDRMGAYIEAQAYDLERIDKDTLGVNAGLRWIF